MVKTWVVSTLMSMLVASAPHAGSAPATLPSSASAVHDLVAEMTEHHLDAIAAEDPEHAGRFVAALLMPGVQLLVVSAEIPARDYLVAQIAREQYRDAYSTVQSAAVKASKLFIQDMGANGLANGDGDVDVMYEQAVKQTVFDGDWKRQKVSKEEYAARLEHADTAYAGMLSVLTQAARGLPAAAK